MIQPPKIESLPRESLYPVELTIKLTGTILPATQSCEMLAQGHSHLVWPQFPLAGAMVTVTCYHCCLSYACRLLLSVSQVVQPTCQIWVILNPLQFRSNQPPAFSPLFNALVYASGSFFADLTAPPLPVYFPRYSHSHLSMGTTPWFKTLSQFRINPASSHGFLVLAGLILPTLPTVFEPPQSPPVLG